MKVNIKGVKGKPKSIKVKMKDGSAKRVPGAPRRNGYSRYATKSQALKKLRNA